MSVFDRIAEIVRIDETKFACPECKVKPGFVCQPSNWPGSHKARKDAARVELRELLAEMLATKDPTP